MNGPAARRPRWLRARTWLCLPILLSIGASSHAVAQANALATERSSDWIDFDFYRDSRIFLPVIVNGHETVGALDSGADMTAIDTEFARLAGIEGSGNASASGTGGSVRVQFASGVSVAVGGLTLSDMRVAITDLSDVADRLLGRPLPVILGAEVFQKVIVDIDYPGRRIAFRDPETWNYEGSGDIVPLTRAGPGRRVELSVEGRDPIVAGFDIGQGAPLTILKPHADRTNLLEGRQSGTVLAGGVGGATVDHIITVEHVEFGGSRFTDVPVLIPTEAIGSFDTTRMQANVGTGIFSRFRMIVDYSRDRLILEPAADAVVRPFRRNRAGVMVERDDGRLEIVHVSPGSPAFAAGLRAGDTITEIDGRPIGEDYWRADMWRWTAEPAGTTVELMIGTGRTFRFRLADYY